MAAPFKHLWIAGWLAQGSLLVFGAQPDFSRKAQEYLQAQVAVNQFSGAVLVVQKGQPLLNEGYGMANRELEVRNTPQTEFRLASITKSFTAIAVLMLQEKGLLDVRDRLSKYYPDGPAVWSDVTLHHLLTHTSGIPEYADDAWSKTMSRRMTKAEVIDLFRNRPLDFKPGDRYRYSNSGYFLLGCVIEKASGQTYEAFVRDHIFVPLEMHDTGCNQIGRILPRRASGYSRNSEGVWENAALMDLSQAYAAGCIYSTVGDVYRLDQALRSEVLLSRRSIETMFTSFTPHYGYGWDIFTRFNRRLISHYGSNAGYTAALDRYPDEDVCVVVLSNQDFRSASTIARDLGAILYAEKYVLPREHQPIALDPRIYDRYAGAYEIGSGKIVRIWRDGARLMQEAPTGAVFEFFPESETTFFGKSVDATFTFIGGEAGVATALAIREGGGDEVVFRRVK